MVDFTKPIQTRDGRKVRILCMNLKANLPIIAAVTNKYDHEDICAYYSDGWATRYKECPEDLVNPTVKKKGWLNIYNEKVAYIHPTKLSADSGVNYKRIACIEIEWEEPA